MGTSPSKQRLIIINASFPLSCLVKPNFSCFSAPEANFLTAMSHERRDVSRGSGMWRGDCDEWRLTIVSVVIMVVMVIGSPGQVQQRAINPSHLSSN